MWFNELFHFIWEHVYCGSTGAAIADCDVGSFNPCCIGLAIAASLFSTYPIIPKFQSLLYWISHCGLMLKNLDYKEEWFQSLLYWISHCGPHRGAMPTGYCSFNPCCIGLAIAAWCGITADADSAGGFNPCCIGLAIAAK